jgi:hypothetical protein
MDSKTKQQLCNQALANLWDNGWDEDIEMYFSHVRKLTPNQIEELQDFIKKVTMEQLPDHERLQEIFYEFWWQRYQNSTESYEPEQETIAYIATCSATLSIEIWDTYIRNYPYISLKEPKKMVRILQQKFLLCDSGQSCLNLFFNSLAIIKLQPAHGFVFINCIWNFFEKIEPKKFNEERLQDALNMDLDNCI